jgi:signal transduction histidine kinase
MGLSRLRLRLTGSYAIGFFAVLIIFNLVVVRAVRRLEENLVTHRLQLAARDLLFEVPREKAERPDASLANAAARVLDEWPSGPDALIVYGADGVLLAFIGAPALVEMAPRVLPAADGFARDTVSALGHRVRRVTASSPLLRTLVIGSLDDTRRAADALGLWLFRLVPILLLASLVLGYFFAGRALAPINVLGGRIAGLAPDRLDARLPVATPPDEIDRLAAQFNALLGRLQEAQLRNRRFVQQAAHQIRTPLTILLGEAALQRSGKADLKELHHALDRIWTSAHQMQRRVDELVTLAAAEAGESPPMGDSVELDALALEATDLMRRRAAALGHPLELLGIDEVSVRGNTALLREALVELLENACRHGEAGATVGVRVVRTAGHAQLEVVNRGGEVALPDRSLQEIPPDGRGLGLSIVRWIAERHGGRLTVSREEDRNVIALILPLTG